MQKGVSVIICTYNGKKRLAKTLQHLAGQEHSCPLEIIVVDNASVDGTREFADNWWNKNGVSTIYYRSFSQPIPGKSNAQELGYEKARYEYLLICDDDNWLQPNYAQIAFDIMESNSQIGALGGWCEAVFEQEKPDWFDTYSRFYAVSKQGSESGDITYKKGCLYGAGMVIRKSHWIHLQELGFKPFLTCRKGNSLSSGGDTEYSYVLRLLGYKIWYDERLSFKHYMPKERLNLNYVSRMRKAMSESNFIVSIYTDELSNKTLTRQTFRKELKKLLRDRLKANLRKRFFGTFEEKEESKEYFRRLKRLAFSFKEYKRNRESLEQWLRVKASE